MCWYVLVLKENNLKLITRFLIQLIVLSMDLKFKIIFTMIEWQTFRVDENVIKSYTKTPFVLWS